MKTIYLVRHAKAEAENASGEDFTRKLTARGKEDAKRMAEKLINKKVRIGLFLSSPANRTKKTCKIFSEIMEMPEAATIFKDELYLAPASSFFSVIRKLPEPIESIAIFSHNPGITDFANALTNVKIDNMPTASIFALTANITSWQKLKDSDHSFLFFERP